MAMAMPNSESMFWKRVIHKYVHLYAFIHMSKARFLKIIIKLGIGIANPIFGKGLNAFWKRALLILKQFLFFQRVSPFSQPQVIFYAELYY